MCGSLSSLSFLPPLAIDPDNEGKKEKVDRSVKWYIYIYFIPILSLILIQAKYLNKIKLMLKFRFKTFFLFGQPENLWTTCLNFILKNKYCIFLYARNIDFKQTTVLHILFMFLKLKTISSHWVISSLELLICSGCTWHEMNMWLCCCFEHQLSNKQNTLITIHYCKSYQRPVLKAMLNLSRVWKYWEKILSQTKNTTLCGTKHRWRSWVIADVHSASLTLFTHLSASFQVVSQRFAFIAHSTAKTNKP